MDKLAALAGRLIRLQDALGGQYGDLSRPQLRLMIKLKGAKPTITELADWVNISSPGVTQMIDKLQARGYVRRESQERDQRLVRVVITSAGSAVLAEAERAFAERVDALMAPLGPREREALLVLLEKMNLEGAP